MNQRRRERLLVVISTALILGLGLWWYGSAEYEEKLIPAPDNPKLRTEHFHVAGHWLEQQGFDAVSFHQLQDQFLEPAEDATLIAAAAVGLQSRLESWQLHDWVERGGHLIAAAPERVSRRSSGAGLNPYGIARCRACRERETEDETDESGQTDVPASRIRLHTPDEQVLALWHSPELQVSEPSDEVEFWHDAHDRPRIASYALGQGRVTLIPSIRWLDNEHLIYPDHARLLTALIDADRGTVYLQQRVAAGGLLGWLWRQAPALWLAALLFGLLWIWSRMPRLGPVMEPAPGENTQIREHLLATARFDWRHNQARNLIAAMREERSQRCTQRFPDWRQLDTPSRAARLAALCPDGTAEQMRWLLNIEGFTRPEPLIAYVALHNKLMHAL